MNPAVYTVGQGIVDNVPASQGGPIDSYGVSPSLPAGLSIDETTGVITGTPAVISPATHYTVTAANSGGSTTATLSITVNDVPPSALSYSPNPAVYTVGQVIASNAPSSSGGAVVSYSISAPLPAGLSFDGTTGVISGTPAVVSPATDYTVTATNSGGSTTATLNITVTAGLQAVISGGSFHTCALVNGGVWCWGRNDLGQLGNGTATDSDVPVPVYGLPSGVQAISAGHFHTCALVNGGAWCWGYNFLGQLGNNSITDSHVPVPVYGLTSGVQAISAGMAHTCALVNGGAWCWGANSNSQLGTNSTTDSHVPVPVFGLTSGVQAIAAGNSHTCVVANGGVQCWGSNSRGGLGNGSFTNSPVPVQVVGLTSGVQAIATGTAHTCALVNGGAWCWGFGVYGGLGNGTFTNSTVPVQVLGLTSGVQAITTGYSHTCVVANGGAQCWGFNDSGQLGNDSTANSSVPVQVLGLASGVQAITAGSCSYHTCALVNGGVRCWGFNIHGQLGNNSTADSHVPVPVSGLGSGF